MSAGHLFSPDSAHLQLVKQQQQHEQERAQAEERLQKLEQVPDIGSAYSEDQRQYQLQVERTNYMRKFENARDVNVVGHSPSPYHYNHPQRQKRLGSEKTRYESPSSQQYAHNPAHSRDTSPAVSVGGRSHGYRSPGPGAQPEYMAHHPAFKGQGQGQGIALGADYSGSAAELKPAYRNASPRTQRGFQSAQRGANMYPSSRSGTPDSRSLHDQSVSDTSHSYSQSQSQSQSSHYIQHQRPMVSGSVAAATPDTNIPVFIRDQAKFQHRNNVAESASPQRGRSPSPRWQGSTGGMVTTPNREYTSGHRSLSPQIASGGLNGRRGTMKNLQGFQVNDVGEVSPWQECYTSSGKRYYYNCLTGQSTYRAPAPPSNAFLR